MTAAEPRLAQDAAAPGCLAADLLRRAALRPVVVELARRMSASTRPVTSITLQLDDRSRHAVADLLGLARLPRKQVQIRTAQLAAALSVDVTELRSVVEAVVGPLENRSEVRVQAQEELRAAAEAAGAAAEPLGAEVVTWAQSAIRSLPGPLTERSAIILAAVSAIGTSRAERLPLPVMAADVLGDPHAFDAGTRGGDVLVACASAAAGVRVPHTALERRGVLARFGIVADELSSTVALWHFPFPNGHPLAAMSAELTAAGEPVVATLSMLQRWPVLTTSGRLLIVENPAILATAAATQFDRPLLCSSGQPSAAAALLLDQVTTAGGHVDAHADFDAGGFLILATLCKLGAAPWRMGVADYEAALGRAGPRRSAGTVPATPWDPRLAAVFAAARRPIYEEQLLDTILV